MAIRFASRTSGFRASAVREMLKLTARRDVVAFGGGLPPSECLPVDEIEASLSRLLRQHGAGALQYSTTEGVPALRALVAERMRERMGVELEPAQVLITTGSQQALDLSGKVFLDEGDAVVCESPTYLAAISAFRGYGASFVSVPSDEHGMLPGELEALVAGNARARLIYVVPEFQNPSGRTWSLARRRALLDVARRHDLPVLEDSPYRDLRFEGEELPSIASLDRDGRVVFTSTFSKVLCPGLRVGWVAAAPAVLERYVLAKQGSDLHTSTLNQLLVAAYVEQHGLEGHLARVRRVCRERRDAMLQAIAEELPADVHVSRPAGGLFVWLELPARFSTREWLQRCLAHGVAFVPGDAFYPNGGGESAARLSYSDTSEPRIREGVRRMAGALRELRGSEALAWPEAAVA